LVALAVTAAAGTAYSQTWVAPNKTPSLLDIVVIDRTGEPKWPYGFEDILGDGMTFTAAEQGLDIRTAYAATDAKRFWFRSYFSSTVAVAPDVTVFVFIDTDKNTATGGSAKQPTIDPAFTTDPTQGGYEVVLSMKGNKTFGPLWTWSQAQNKFVSSVIKANQGVASAGVDNDPVLFGAGDHGYIQGSVDFALVGLDQTCQADLFVRSVNSAGKGDHDVGGSTACRAADANNDGIPDILVPPQCNTDADCPDKGICIDHVCHLPEPCRVDADCKGANMMCTTDGRCVPKPMGTCQTNADCTGGLVCNAGTCTACDFGTKECGPGEVCLASGICVMVSTGAGGNGAGGGSAGGGGGLAIPPGGGVRGGACTCTTAGSSGDETFALVALAPALAWLSRRRRSQSRRHRS
jgi:uncharacterized protein (TIGR03382 family)